jgi:hypothetical protein
VKRYLLSGFLLLATVPLVFTHFLGPVKYRNPSVGGLSVIAGAFLLLFASGLFRNELAFQKMRSRIKTKTEERVLLAIGFFVFFLGAMLIFDFVRLK